MPVGPIKGARATGPISLSEVLRYAFELFIFFIGVYLAFLLTDYQEQQRELEVQAKYYESLIQECLMLVRHLDDEEEKLKGHLHVIAEINEGNRPLIPTSNLYYLHRGLVVNSAFEGLNFESLNSGIIGAIINSVPLLELLDRRIGMFNQLSSSLPTIQIQGDSCCYGDDGALLPHMEWYPRLIGEVHELNREIRTGVVEVVIPEVKAWKEQIEKSIR